MNPLSSRSPVEILAEIEDVQRNTPSVDDFANIGDTELAWLGRASAAINRWDSIKAVAVLSPLVRRLQIGIRDAPARNAVIALLHEAAYDLRMNTVGPVTQAIGAGDVFDYFDGLRKIIETVNIDLLFVDPYLEAEFVSRYLPYVSTGVTVRLLAEHKMSQLRPAVSAFCQQTSANVEVRAGKDLHDRYLFVDKARCYLSGASFKDGAKKSPTTLTQIVDACAATLEIYEQYWSSSQPIIEL